MRLFRTIGYLAVTTLALVVTIVSSSASASASSDHLSAPYDVACLNAILPAQSTDDAQELCDGYWMRLVNYVYGVMLQVSLDCV
jgi:hypothetical protein